MTEIIMLSDEERIRFARYCEAESISAAEMAKQCDKLSGMILISKKYRAESLAFKVIAHILNDTETVSLGSKE